jgi:polyisoprenoid-binding protein YceI
MATWLFEPGHAEPEFRAPHMMVTWVISFGGRFTEHTAGDICRD